MRRKKFVLSVSYMVISWIKLWGICTFIFLSDGCLTLKLLCMIDPCVRQLCVGVWPYVWGRVKWLKLTSGKYQSTVLDETRLLIYAWVLFFYYQSVLDVILSTDLNMVFGVILNSNITKKPIRATVGPCGKNFKTTVLISTINMISDGTLSYLEESDKLQQLSLHCLAAGEKVILFGVPRTSTPCSMMHVPYFIEKAEELTPKGVGWDLVDQCEWPIFIEGI